MNPLTGDGVSPREMQNALPEIGLSLVPTGSALWLKAAGKFTSLYQKVGVAGEHLKFGISSSPWTRVFTRRTRRWELEDHRDRIAH